MHSTLPVNNWEDMRAMAHIAYIIQHTQHTQHTHAQHTASFSVLVYQFSDVFGLFGSRIGGGIHLLAYNSWFAKGFWKCTCLMTLLFSFFACSKGVMLFSQLVKAAALTALIFGSSWGSRWCRKSTRRTQCRPVNSPTQTSSTVLKIS